MNHKKLILKNKRTVATKLLKKASVAIDEIEELKRLLGVPPFQMEARLKEMQTNACQVIDQAALAAKEVEELESIML